MNMIEKSLPYQASSKLTVSRFAAGSKKNNKFVIYSKEIFKITS